MAKRIAAATLALALAALAFPAGAQTDQDRRLDRLETQLHELRSIVFQGRETGQPVIVKPDGPDPAVQALSARIDDLDAAVRKVSGQVEVSQHDLDLTRQNAQGAHDSTIEMRAQIQSLSDRLARLEAGGGGATAPAPQAQADTAPVAPPETRPARRSSRTSGDATAQAQADDQGVLGGPPTDAASTDLGAFKGAAALQASGDYPGATSAWQGYITRYGQGPRGREARYRLGETLYLQSSYGEAARAYAEALRGWPKTTWAPEATVKLSQALAQVGRREEACSVVSEFDTRYAATASTAVKTRARTAHKAACAG